MAQFSTFNLVQGKIFGYNHRFNGFLRKPNVLVEQKKSSLCHGNGNSAKFPNCGGLSFLWPGSLERLRCAVGVDVSCKAKVLEREEVFPPIQTLRRFPVEELYSKTVLVRFDSSILVHFKLDQTFSMNSSAYLTIKHIHKAGAKIILISSWNVKQNADNLSQEAVAEFLSSILELKVVADKHIFLHQRPMMEQFELSDIVLLDNLSNYKQELANSSDFARRLVSGVDIFVNDSFSSAHKILASTVGVTQFCCVCLAGFYLEDNLNKLKKITECKRSPYIAVVRASCT